MASKKQEREDIRVHLQMMQSVIARMADNSRACKTWAVTLVAAILVVVARFGMLDEEPALDADAVWIALGPAILFWVLDSYYLSQERGFRASYDEFIAKFHSGKLDRDSVFDIQPRGSRVEVFSWLRLLFRSGCSTWCWLQESSGFDWHCDRRCTVEILPR